MSDLHAALLETIKSPAFAGALEKLSEDEANAFGGILMAIVNGQFGQPQQTGPRILTEEEFMKMSPAQIKKLEKYNEYLAGKQAESQAQDFAGELQAASARLDDMRAEQRRSWAERRKHRDKWLDKMVAGMQ